MLLLPSGPREALDLVEKQPPRPARPRGHTGGGFRAGSGRRTRARGRDSSGRPGRGPGAALQFVVVLQLRRASRATGGGVMSWIWTRCGAALCPPFIPTATAQGLSRAAAEVAEWGWQMVGCVRVALAGVQLHLALLVRVALAGVQLRLA